MYTKLYVQRKVIMNVKYESLQNTVIILKKKTRMKLLKKINIFFIL